MNNQANFVIDREAAKSVPVEYVNHAEVKTVNGEVCVLLCQRQTHLAEVSSGTTVVPTKPLLAVMMTVPNLTDLVNVLTTAVQRENMVADIGRGE